jgi:hypothetical protein
MYLSILIGKTMIMCAGIFLIFTVVLIKIFPYIVEGYENQSFIIFLTGYIGGMITAFLIVLVTELKI